VPDRRHRRPAASLAALLAILLLAGLPAAAPAAPAGAGVAAAAQTPAGKHHAKRKPLPRLALSAGLTSGPGTPISHPPVGLSIEYPLMASYLGTGPCPPPALAAELLRLGSPRIALAGQSQDFTVPSGLAPPGPVPSWEAGIFYTLPAEFFSQLRCLLSTSKDPLTVGLNARNGQLAWAEAMVSAAQRSAAPGLDFSIGNEPDHYYLPNYLSLTKSQPGEEEKAVGLYLQIASVLRPALGTLPLIGPELAIPNRWQASLPRVISTLHPQTVGVHAYPLTVCRSPREATIHGLLAASIGNQPRRLAWVVADARAAGLPAVISEANSVSCGGKAGVSDSPAAAVWTVRFLLAALETGFGEVRFHLSGNPYDPFYMRGGEVVRRPFESALVSLQQWLAPGATLRTVNAPGNLEAATISAPGAEPLLILDNESRKPASLVLRGASAVHVVQGFSPGAAKAAVGPAPHGSGAGASLVKLPANGVLALHFTP
jgi:hypothetical protein